MLHRTVWDEQSARSIKKLVLVYKQEYDNYVTWNCMGHAVRQFEKEVSFRLATGEVLSN